MDVGVLTSTRLPTPLPRLSQKAAFGTPSDSSAVEQPPRSIDWSTTTLRRDGMGEGRMWEAFGPHGGSSCAVADTKARW
jgi:hypothetical protein